MLHVIYINFWLLSNFQLSFTNVNADVFDYDLYEDALDYETCEKQMKEINHFEFYDASFRIPQSLLRGGLASLGNYHQCLSIKQHWSEGYVDGKYCMLAIPLIQNLAELPDLSTGLPVNIKWTNFNVTWPDVNVSWSWERFQRYRQMKTENAIMIGKQLVSLHDSPLQSDIALCLGVCIPKSCTVQDALEPYFRHTVHHFNYTQTFCRLANDKPFVVADYIAIGVFTFIGILSIISTGYDLYKIVGKEAGPRDVNDILSCCSIYTNTKNLFTFKTSPGTVECLDGIRAVTILWIVAGHTFAVYLSGYSSNIFDVFEWLSSYRSLWITSATICVDTFFTLSGILLVYATASKFKTRHTFLKSIHVFYLGRLLRIFPLLAAAVLLQASLFHHAADGAGWLTVGDHVRDCRRYWWSALLHVQNWVNSGETCLPHTWYLSVDVQLHILSPLVLVWILDTRRRAWIALIVANLTSLIATTIYCFTNNFKISSDKYYRTFYPNTLTRAPPFIIGMLFGYLLLIFRGKQLQLSKLLVIINHIAAFVLCFVCFYQVHVTEKPDWDNQLAENFINSYMRAFWALSLGWLIIACVHGYGGPVNWFLSLRMWKFWSRISYAMFLFHYPLQHIFAGASITPIYFSDGIMLSKFASDLAATVLFSVAACVLIDIPSAVLSNKLLNSLRASSYKAKKPITTVDEIRNEENVLERLIKHCISTKEGIL